MDLIYFMNDKLKKDSKNDEAIRTMTNFLKEYILAEPIAIMPDFTNSNTLPVGTTTIINNKQALNPSFVGMDIGCGYQLFTAEINPKRFFKNGKFKLDKTKEFIDELAADIIHTQTTPDKQLGTIGKGNHFVNMYAINDLKKEWALKKTAITPKSVSFLIHTGSRDRGFQIHKKYSELFKSGNLDPEEFNQRYLKAFKEALNYARVNRDEIRHKITRHLENYPTHLIFDKTHNDIDILDNGNYRIRKGTTLLNPKELFVIPSTATEDAYLIRGRAGLENSHNTINHGCGRKYTRSQMFSKYAKTNFSHMFKDVALNVSYKQMVEEIPTGYKRIDDVIKSITQHNLAEVIGTLKPLGVIVER